MHHDLRLRFLKALINVPLRVLDRVLPDVEPVWPQTRIYQRVHRRMLRAYQLEVAQGVFREDDGRVSDGNFLRLLRVSQKLITRAADDDMYYREWLGLLVVLCREEYERYLAEVSPSEIKRLCTVQWTVSPHGLSDRFVGEFREEFVPDVLTYYLHGLSKSQLVTIKQKWRNKKENVYARHRENS